MTKAKKPENGTAVDLPLDASVLDGSLPPDLAGAIEGDTANAIVSEVTEGAAANSIVADVVSAAPVGPGDAGIGGTVLMEDDAEDASAEDLSTPAPQGEPDAEAEQAQDLSWLLKPETDGEAIHFLTQLGAVDPEGAARLAWPDLFLADLPPETSAPKLSEKDLRATLADIEARNSDLTLPGLLQDLAAIDGALVDHFPDGSAKVSVHGLSVTAPSIRLALTNWCSKARRAVMSGEAA